MSTEPEQGPPDEDVRWREIVDNYGDRAELPDPDPQVAPEPVPASEPDEAVLPPELREAHFVPPQPPPVGFPTGPRLVACIGLFGGPGLILAMLLFKIVIPTWLGWFALLGFIGGFGFLVASVRERDEWDDGSQV